MEKKMQYPPSTLFARIEKQHPFLTMLYFAMSGSGFLFLVLLSAFTKALAEANIPNFKFPIFFIISTFVILMSSYFAQKIWKNFQQDEAKQLYQNLIALLLIGVLFSIAQFIGWRELITNGVLFSGKKAVAASSYLYVLTGLHIVHLGGGLIFTFLQVTHYQKATKDSVQALILFSNKYEKMKMQLLKDYWHFLDILWIIIFLYLLVTI
jgi:cytochrome c oxidase subunit III